MPVLYDGVISVSTSPPIPDGEAMRTGISRTSRPSSAAPDSCAAPPVRITPAGSMPTPAARISLRSSSNVSRMRASMIWQTSSRLTVRPASSPSTRHADLLVVGDVPQIARPVADLQLLGHLEARLEADRDVVRDVVAAHRQDPRVERRALLEQGEVDRPGADVGDRDAELLLGLGQHGLGRGQRVRDELVDLDARRLHALGQVLDRGGGRGDDVRLDLESQGAHPERILDALLAVDGEPPPLDVEHLAVRRDRTARATSIARLMSSRVTSR